MDKDDLINPRIGISDKKSYKFCNFPNGLEVLVISSQSKRNIGAAAMLVDAGSFLDVDDVGGLAHYLEHMVFMGSSKYSSENAYDSFVSKHGGQCNASTDGSYTLYNFDISADHYFDALDIFANCFIAPLLSSEVCDRELKAIDNEFNLAKDSDSCRLQEIFCYGANDDHVIRKFSWGNFESLSLNPKSKGINVGDELRRFQTEYYQPHNCKLVLLSPYSLDTMIRNAESIFSEWKSISCNSYFSNKNSKISLENPFKHQCSKIFRVVSLKNNTYDMNLTWVLPSVAKDYRKKNVDYISHLLGHEGKGSILYRLKSVGYATDLSAGVSTESIYHNEMYSVFSLYITLTVQGMANWVEVVSVVYEYLRMMAREGPQSWIYEELKTMGQLEFDYQDEEDESDFVEDLALNMSTVFSIAREDLLSSSDIFFEPFDPSGVSELLTYLRPESSRIYLLSSIFMDKEYEEKEEDDDEDDDNDDDDEDVDDEDREVEEKEIDEEMDARAKRVKPNEMAADGTKDTLNMRDLEPIHSTEFENVQKQLIEAYTWDLEYLHLSIAPTKDKAPLVEPSFRTEFWVDNTPDKLLDIWQRGDSAFEGYKLHFPAPNLYIPEILTNANYPVMNGNPDMKSHINLSNKINQVEEKASKANTSNLAKSNNLKKSGKHIKPSALIESSMANANSHFATNDTKPEVVYQTDAMKLWHLSNLAYNVPKVDIYIKLSSFLLLHGNQEIHADIGLCSLLNDLMCNVIKDVLNETIYVAGIAGIECEINSHEVGYTIAISGFSSKCDILVSHILSRVKYLDLFNEDITSDVILRQLEILYKHYVNLNMKAAVVTREVRLEYLIPNKTPNARKLELIEIIRECFQSKGVVSGVQPEERCADVSNISNLQDMLISLGKEFSDDITSSDSKFLMLAILKSFYTLFLRYMVIEAFAEGDIDKLKFKNLFVENDTKYDCSNITIAFDGQNQHLSPVVEVRAIRKSQIIFMPVPLNNRSNGNCGVEIYFQIETLAHYNSAVIHLIEYILQEPYFNEIRTQQQIGYSVNCQMKQTFNMLGMVFNAVSSSHGLIEVNKAIYKFILNIPKLLKDLTKDQFTNYKHSLSKILLMPASSLDESAANHWEQIDNQMYDFSLNEAKVNVLKNIHLNDVVSFAKKYFIQKDRKGLVVHASLDFNEDYSDDDEEEDYGDDGGSMEEGGMGDGSEDESEDDAEFVPSYCTTTILSTLS